jgi:hypothetical protein
MFVDASAYPCCHFFFFDHVANHIPFNLLVGTIMSNPVAACTTCIDPPCAYFDEGKISVILTLHMKNTSSRTYAYVVIHVSNIKPAESSMCVVAAHRGHFYSSEQLMVAL